MNFEKKMKSELITSDLIIANVLDRWPETIDVFIERRMSCPGCYLSRFDTLEDAAETYGLAEDAFLEELNRAAHPESESELEKG